MGVWVYQHVVLKRVVEEEARDEKHTGHTTVWFALYMNSRSNPHGGSLLRWPLRLRTITAHCRGSGTAAVGRGRRGKLLSWCAWRSVPGSVCVAIWTCFRVHITVPAATPAFILVCTLVPYSLFFCCWRQRWLDA